MESQLRACFDAKLVASPLVLVSLRIFTKNTPLKANGVLVKIPYFNACLDQPTLAVTL
jgi:hypothetical protein